MNNTLKRLIKLFYDKLVHRKKLKFDFVHYLDTIYYVLRNGIAWRNIKDSKCHYTTYFKFFKKLSDNNIFYYALKSLTLFRNHKYPTEFRDLFIDSTMIKNINGKDLLGKNHYDRYRKGNKITAIVNNQGIPISITLDKANKHDSKLIENAIFKSTIKISGSNLVGDKGYINPIAKDNLKTRKIKLIHPYRNNQNKKNTKSEKLLLKKRHIVENFFCWLKKYRKVTLRYDSKSKNYLAFVYFASLCIAFPRTFY